MQSDGTSRRWLEAAAFSGMFVFGMVMALLGAILPLIAQHLKIDLARAGFAFSVLGAAMLVSGFVTGPFMDRYGKRMPMVAGPLLAGVAVWMLAVAGSYESLLAAVLLLGIGGGAVNNVTNALVSDLYEDPRQKGAALNLLGTMFGVGALALPFAIGRLLATAGLQNILYGAAAASVAAGLFAAGPRYPAPAHEDSFSAGRAMGLIRNPDVLALGGSLFLQSGNEFVLSGFITTFLTTIIGLSVTGANYILAIYWASILVSRLITSRILLRVPAPYVLITGALGAAAGVALIASSNDRSSAVFGVVVLGLCISCIFPTTLGVAGARLRSYPGTVFGMLFATSLAGGTIVPGLFGRVAQGAGLRTALILAVVTFCGIAAIHALYTLRTEPKSTRSLSA